MANEPMPQEAQGAPPDQGGGDPMKAIMDLGASLSGLGDALGQSGAPKEVLMPLQASIQAYGEFVNALQGKGAQPMAQATMNEGGNPNAQPAY